MYYAYQVCQRKKTEGWTIVYSVREKAKKSLEDIGGGWYDNQKPTIRNKIDNHLKIESVLRSEGNLLKGGGIIGFSDELG